MKTIQKVFKKSSRSISDDYKSIDSSVVPVTTVKLSARTRSQQRKDVKTKRLPLEQVTEGLSRLAAPKQICHQPENQSSKISKSALKYKASKRIQSLAKPRMIVPKVSKTISSQGSFQSTVSARALNYVPTPRILELARPRHYEIYEEFQDETDDEVLF